MAATLAKEILSPDGLLRVCIYRNSAGVFYYQEDWYRDYSDDEEYREHNLTGIGDWQDGSPSGYYRTAHEAEQAARAVILWLVGQKSADLLPFALPSARKSL